MTKKTYRVGEGASPKVIGRGKAAGDTVELTEAEALYEVDMGRLEPVHSASAETHDPAAPVG